MTNTSAPKKREKKFKTSKLPPLTGAVLKNKKEKIRTEVHVALELQPDGPGSLSPLSGKNEPTVYSALHLSLKQSDREWLKTTIKPRHMRCPAPASRLYFGEGRIVRMAVGKGLGRNARPGHDGTMLLIPVIQQALKIASRRM